jgi:hypothetical protein
VGELKEWRVEPSAVHFHAVSGPVHAMGPTESARRAGIHVASNFVAVAEIKMSHL